MEQNKKPLILIVDDTHQNIQMLGNILHEKGYSINIATSGNQALQSVNTHTPDLILLDIKMPEMDGFEVCSIIRSNDNLKNIPIIFLTADTDRESILKGFTLGGQDYITKPFDSRELLVRVRTHLSLKQSIESLEELNQTLEQKIKERTKELTFAKEKAEESDRLKTAFLMNMSLEIRTPMNGILGFLSLLKEPDLSEENKSDYIHIVNISGERLMNTINDIIEISKIEVGDFSLDIQDVDIFKLMQYFIETFKLQTQEKGLNFSVVKQITGDAAVIKSDKLKIDCIMKKLINNAIKFTKKGKIEIGNYIEEGKLWFYVSDTGEGIKNDKIDSIFNRFVQADEGHTRGYEGSGIGLSIVKSYVEALNGNVMVKSKIGKGSTFLFSIPYQASSDYRI